MVGCFSLVRREATAGGAMDEIFVYGDDIDCAGGSEAG
jgi:hypothetical protein